MRAHLGNSKIEWPALTFSEVASNCRAGADGFSVDDTKATGLDGPCDQCGKSTLGTRTLLYRVTIHKSGVPGWVDYYVDEPCFIAAFEGMTVGLFGGLS